MDASPSAYHELGDLFGRNALLLQNRPLVDLAASGLRDQLRLLSVELTGNRLLRLLRRGIAGLLLLRLLCTVRQRKDSVPGNTGGQPYVSISCFSLLAAAWMGIPVQWNAKGKMAFLPFSAL